MDHKSQVKHSIITSCRFEKTLYDLLQKESKEKGLSFNALLVSILKRYISWEKYAAEIGFIPLAKETVRLLFDNMDEKKSQLIAERLGRTVPRELILLMFNKIDFNSIIAFLEITLSRYGMVQHKISGGMHDLIVFHNVNEKFSEFLVHAAKVMADDLSIKLQILNSDSSILALRIEEIKQAY